VKNWRLRFFLLAPGVFSQATWCSETPEQAITRIYHSPEDRMNYDIGLRGEMLENHRTASVASKPLFSTLPNALCLCNNPDNISVEIRHVLPYSNRFAEAHITLNEKKRSRSMKIQLFKPHDRWLLTDVDNLDDPLPSLMWQLRDDTQSKLLLAPQLATNSHKVEDVAISELLANPDKYHQKKVRLRGYAILGFEHAAIYANKDEIQREKGFWLKRFKRWMQR